MVLSLEFIAKPSSLRFRSIISQVISCMAQNLMLLDLALAVGFATIIIPDLLDSKSKLSMNDVQASWFGSIGFLLQPFGAILSAPFVDHFGRKYTSFMVNIPHVIAWILMYYASTVTMLFTANALLGFGTGLMEAPLNAYVGEITEPSLRGILCTSTQMFYSTGVLLMYFLGKIINWREAALISLAAPVASMLFIILVPETPVWLLSRGREKEAMKSLCYLRGWTTPDNVRDEFDQLAVYCKKLECCAICCKTDEDEIVDCEHKKANVFKRIYLKFRYVMLAKETLRPFMLMIMYFLFISMNGLTPIRPNMINICDAFGMATGGKNIAVMVGIILLIANCLTIVLIKILGKRKLAITSLFGSAFFSMALSIYGGKNLESSVFSYDSSTFPKEHSYVPLILFYLLVFCYGFIVPWILIGEVFPFKSRALAQGVVAAFAYIFMFIGSKTFLNFEVNLKLSGAFAVYAAFGYAGTIYLYFFLPETEGKTLQDIESYFSGKFRTFADDPCINFFKRFRKK